MLKKEVDKFRKTQPSLTDDRLKIKSLIEDKYFKDLQLAHRSRSRFQSPSPRPDYSTHHFSQEMIKKRLELSILPLTSRENNYSRGSYNQSIQRIGIHSRFGHTSFDFAYKYSLSHDADRSAKEKKSFWMSNAKLRKRRKESDAEPVPRISMTANKDDLKIDAKKKKAKRDLPEPEQNKQKDRQAQWQKEEEDTERIRNYYLTKYQFPQRHNPHNRRYFYNSNRNKNILGNNKPDDSMALEPW